MFGKRSPPKPGADAPETEIKRRAAEALERARAGKASGGSLKIGTAGSEAPKKPRTYAAPNTRRTRLGLPGTIPVDEGRKLVVGRDISLSGEIKACEKLIVEGRVAANLKDCKILQISSSGLYEGAAEVDQAEISGRFEGELTVRGTVTLRATGRVKGRLRYGEMEIERGGKVNGTLEEISAPSDAAETDVAAGRAPTAASVARAKHLRAKSGASESTASESTASESTTA